MSTRVRKGLTGAFKKKKEKENTRSNYGTRNKKKRNSQHKKPWLGKSPKSFCVCDDRKEKGKGEKFGVLETSFPKITSSQEEKPKGGEDRGKFLKASFEISLVGLRGTPHQRSQKKTKKSTSRSEKPETEKKNQARTVRRSRKKGEAGGKKKTTAQKKFGNQNHQRTQRGGNQKKGDSRGTSYPPTNPKKNLPPPRKKHKRKHCQRFRTRDIAERNNGTNLGKRPTTRP